MLEKPIRKKIHWTIIETGLYNPITNEVQEHTTFRVPKKLKDNEECRKYLKENCNEPTVLLKRYEHITLNYEITIEDFLSLAKVVNEESQTPYYIKKKK